ncbi:MAG: PPOX class F420-dependent oxidoreductase [Ilumatobacteraceae bacterium]
MAITDEKYVLLTTFRKNGDAVPTAVWIVGMPDGTAGLTTEETAGKVKRIRNDPSVTLQPCSMRGNVQPGSIIVNATAEVLVGPGARPITNAIRRKYRVVTVLLSLSDLIRKLFRRAEAPDCAVRLSFDKGTS